jgi:AbrB family looped-hinge helix DNA binding protein
MRTDHVKLGEDGRIVIPAATRHELGFNPGETLILESDGDSLLIRRHQNVLREIQDYFQQFATPGVSEVDVLIAERRAEFARENAKESSADSLRRRS